MANVQTSKQAKPRSCVWDNMRTKKTPMITSVTISLPGSTRWWWRWPRPRQWPTPCGRVTMWEQPFLFRKMSHNFRKRISGLQHESNKSILVFLCFLHVAKILNFDMSTFLRCLPTFSLSTGISLGKCKKSQNFSNTAQSQCVLNSILSQYTDELTPHVEWLEDKKTLANRWKFFVPLIFAI